MLNSVDEYFEVLCIARRYKKPVNLTEVVFMNTMNTQKRLTWQSIAAGASAIASASAVVIDFEWLTTGHRWLRCELNIWNNYYKYNNNNTSIIHKQKNIFNKYYSLVLE